MTTSIPKIVLTGGPCAGKTSAQDFLSVKLREEGFTPFFVPEAPTILLADGYHPRDGIRMFQERVIDLILTLEREYAAKAQAAGERPILICDRGLMDARAYTPKDMFEDILLSQGIHIAEARDAWYDAVIHLRSAAIGAEAFYGNANNRTRYESLEEARAADHRTLGAWLGHSRLRIIGNDGDFDRKLAKTWVTLRHLLGIPAPLEIERRFLIAPPDIASLGPSHAVEIEQCYLVPSGGKSVRRARKRTSSGMATYYEATKRHVRSGANREEEWRITEARYAELLACKDPATAIVEKVRNYFVWNDQYFELDAFKGAQEGLFILEIELLDEHDPVELPPFIKVLEEVTGKREWSNRAIAER